LPFNFGLLEAPWHARAIAQLVDRYEAALPAGASWPNWVLGNHDRPRLASRLGLEQTRLAAMLLLTLHGTPTLYYGDETGMRQVPMMPMAVRDPLEKNVPGLGRDGCRTPMQWRRRPALTLGAYRPMASAGDVFAFVRKMEGDRVLLALNFAASPAAVSLPSDRPAGVILLSSGAGRDGENVRLSFDLQAH
jgi:alpha-glucosidase